MNFLTLENTLVLLFVIFITYILYRIIIEREEKYTNFSEDFNLHSDKLDKVEIPVKTMEEVTDELSEKKENPYKSEITLSTFSDDDERNDLEIATQINDENVNILMKETDKGMGWMKDEKSAPELYGGNPTYLPY